uniref:MHD domain-containing protein n=1 Tax=Chlamydomonas leiostraca TaxID=1034604 RepID=A0A7S0S210_9CHLO|mmetsp:Transcript_38186/g.96667  ORF Transcript_38186/g.96667 Transcript_38186/m.96667 type:complete len:428 (+) Transcript_38186:176-1459(+)|eukprot:CAMPEP_0202866696 /NCGR_PEP_ID=MMETSP1391-20130828/8309_1 /ASSEMBLY_ACC=CAM_ASM_000867 /TAXON_ID=1034604 /ORGANISM="Chlamydomonas leiostraca, Strain SAG 11-49" /LENGTH=427 /DNA_ID=CAMNT_0049546669 /DNA_START=176 /DNA_END=1459 /DNA_ORIENTATION=-
MYPSCLSAIYFLNLRGDILLERRYRDDVDREIAENFRAQILNNKGEALSPVKSLGSMTFMFLRHADMYILSITRSNSNVMLAFKFMTCLVDMFKSYFESELNEASVRNNFVLMYELLDEAMDNGYPQLTDPTVLKSLITQKGFKGDLTDLLQKVQKKEEPAPNATLQVTGAVSWRREGIKYKKNELFLDIVEQVNLLMSATGTVLRSDVAGKIMIKALLSDMPELRLGLNDAAQDATFHQCVNLGTYESQKVVTFVPPDGEFELMRYRCQDNINLPFKVLCVINEMAKTRLECTVTVKSSFSSKLYATNVVLLVPVPDNTSKANILVTSGKAKYDATRKALVWKVGRFQGEAEHTLRAEVMVMATTRTDKKPWVKPPIAMQFQVPMFSASGLRVSYLQIVERKQGSAYKVDKWVRKMVRSGDYLHRL